MCTQVLLLSARVPGVGTGKDGDGEEQTTPSLEMGTWQLKLKAHGAALQDKLGTCIHSHGGQRLSLGTIHLVFETGCLTGLGSTNSLTAQGAPGILLSPPSRAWNLAFSVGSGRPTLVLLCVQ